MRQKSPPIYVHDYDDGKIVRSKHTFSARHAGVLYNIIRNNIMYNVCNITRMKCGAATMQYSNEPFFILDDLSRAYFLK